MMIIQNIDKPRIRYDTALPVIGYCRPLDCPYDHIMTAYIFIYNICIYNGDRTLITDIIFIKRQRGALIYYALTIYRGNDAQY